MTSAARLRLDSNKESAFVHALYAGAIGHAVAKACARGQIPDCQCGEQPKTIEETFVWAGCADNVRFGNWFSRRLADAAEKNRLDSKYLLLIS